MVLISEITKITDPKYDVFLSFRGEDTRNGFTINLYNALMNANISTFMDDEKIHNGQSLKPELESAIKESRASIIVLSKNYATSTWCLDELVLILEQLKTSNHIVIPIFYGVVPTDVRNQTSSFEEAMNKHKQMMEVETDAIKKSDWVQKIERWIQALEEFAGLKGVVVKDRSEMEFIEKIVKDIHRRLEIYRKIPLIQLYGMADSIDYVTSWLKDASSNSSPILTICGMGGIGKTSLAKHVYTLHSHEFDTSSLIEDINRTFNENVEGLLDLQKQLCDDILKSKSSSTHGHNASIYTSMIENALARKKVFLVLDDLDSFDQLDEFLGSKGLHPESKVIITTRDLSSTRNCTLLHMNVNLKHVEYSLEALPLDDSRQLLCFHAFKGHHPKEGYEMVVTKIVTYCQGHPLALKVLGMSLRNRDVAYWEECIERVKKNAGSRIHEVLKMSYDSLHEDDKKLFMDIACFFVGTNKNDTETILEACYIKTKSGTTFGITSGITHLTEKCLLSIRWDKKVMMHRLLQDMGRLIVHQESPESAGDRSRLWCHEDSFKVLEQKVGTKRVRGLTLNMRLLENVKLNEPFELKTDALSEMKNLLLLQLNFVEMINGSYEKFPKHLRWLCMHGFPLNCIPLDLPMDYLVVLDMSYSKIKSFGICYCNPQCPEKRHKFIGSCSKDKRLLGSLKILKLSFCRKLSSLGGFDKLPALQKLIAINCIDLVEVCKSIGKCVELVLIDLSYCKKLEKLPETMHMLEKVEKLLLTGCNLGKSWTEMKDIVSSTSMMATPSYSKFFKISLPRSLVSLSLENNNLSTKSFPMDFSELHMLKKLKLDKNPIDSIPNCVRSLTRLEKLSMRDCVELKSVEHPPRTLTHLILDCQSKYTHNHIEKVVFHSEMPSFKFDLGRDRLPDYSFESEGMIKSQPMAVVEEKVLRRLGWKKLNLLKQKRLLSYDSYKRKYIPFDIQMYYEFGIFSTIYRGDKMPNWITNTSMGKSISFTIPSSSKNITGLNFCSVQKLQLRNMNFDLSKIIIRNETKNRTWIYQHYLLPVRVYGDYFTMLSHWMFGVNEFERGDHVIITCGERGRYTKVSSVTKECGVSFVYDDGKTDEEEEDALAYYKSWNHIIGGDLSPFQTTTGDYFLDFDRFSPLGMEVDEADRTLVGNYKASYAYNNTLQFRPFSQKKSDILGHPREEEDGEDAGMVGSSGVDENAEEEEEERGRGRGRGRGRERGRG